MHRDGAPQGGEGSPSLRLPDGREEDSSCGLLPATDVCPDSKLLPSSGLELLSTGRLVLSACPHLLRRGTKLLSLTSAIPAMRSHDKSHPGSFSRAWVLCCALRNPLSSSVVRRMTEQFWQDDRTP